MKMKILSTKSNLRELPDDMLMEIETRLRNVAIEYEKRANDYVSRYGELHNAHHLYSTLIDEINKEIRKYQNGQQTKVELDQEIDAIIGDRGMGGKKRRTKSKRTKSKRSIKRRK
jgi:hypothetical protein